MSKATRAQLAGRRPVASPRALRAHHACERVVLGGGAGFRGLRALMLLEGAGNSRGASPRRLARTRLRSALYSKWSQAAALEWGHYGHQDSCFCNRREPGYACKAVSLCPLLCRRAYRVRSGGQHTSCHAVAPAAWCPAAARARCAGSRRGTSRIPPHAGASHLRTGHYERLQAPSRRNGAANV